MHHVCKMCTRWCRKEAWTCIASPTKPHQQMRWRGVSRRSVSAPCAIELAATPGAAEGLGRCDASYDDRYTRWRSAIELAATPGARACASADGALTGYRRGCPNRKGSNAALRGSNAGRQRLRQCRRRRPRIDHIRIYSVPGAGERAA